MNKRDDILDLSADEYASTYARAYADTIIENYCCLMDIFLQNSITKKFVVLMDSK